MNIKAYLYSTIFSNTPIGMFPLNVESDGLEITYDDLNNFSQAKFSLSLDSEIYELSKIKIYEGNVLVFTGYVSQVEPILDLNNKTKNITCYSEKRYLSELNLLSNINITGTPQDLIDELANQYNSLGYSWSGDTDSIAIVSKAGEGSVWFDVINDLNLQRTVIDGVVIIKNNIGEDKTFGTDVQELRYTPYESNVSSVKPIIKGGNVDLVIGSDTAGNTFKRPQPTPALVRSTRFTQFREGNLAQQTKDFYTSITNSNISYQATIDMGAINASVGDRVLLTIKGFGQYNFSGSVFVVKKVSTYKDGVRVDTYDVSESSGPSSGFLEQFRNLIKDVSRMQTTT